MGRLPRLQFPGACYRVTLRGDGGDPVFLDDADRARALDLLAEMKRRFHMRVYAWCLLDSRIELALETPEGNLSRAMQGFATAYTKYFNGRRRRTGHVFGGRYRSELVDKGEALAELTRRIHLAPLTAPLSPAPPSRGGGFDRLPSPSGGRDRGRGVFTAPRFRWSSCRAYTEGPRDPGLVDTETVLAQFGRSRFRQSIKYLKFLQMAVDGCRLSVDGGDRAPLPLTTRHQPSTASEGVGALIDLEELVAEAGARSGVRPEEIRSRFRSPAVCRARREVARRAWDAGVKVSEIAAALRKTPAAVSQMVRAAAVPGTRARHECQAPIGECRICNENQAFFQAAS